MRILFFLFTLIFFFQPILAAEQISLAEIFNPSSIKVGNNQVYITQGVNVFIYSKEDFRLLKKFGKPGEGPKEFKKSPAPWIPSLSLYVDTDKIYINSIGKISTFSKKGAFIKEQRTAAVGIFGRYLPFGKNFVLLKYHRENNKNIVLSSLVNSDLKPLKEICRIDFPEQQGKKRNPILMAKMASYFDRYVYKEKLVIPLDDGTVKIFDHTGNETKTFRPEYTLAKVNSQMEKRLDEFFSNHAQYKIPYLNDKGRNLITFGDHLPIFNYYKLADDKIYIFSNFKKDKKYETFIYDFHGKLIKLTFILLENLDIFNVYPFDIRNGKVYQLVNDDEEEETKLIITKI